MSHVNNILDESWAQRSARSSSYNYDLIKKHVVIDINGFFYGPQTLDDTVISETIKDVHTWRALSAAERAKLEL